MSFESRNKSPSIMSCKNENKAQKRKYVSDAAFNNDQNTLNDLFNKKKKKMKKNDDIFPENNEVVSSKTKKRKRNKKKKMGKDVPQNDTRLNLHASNKNNLIISSAIENENKNRIVTDNSAQHKNVISPEKSIKPDNHNFEDSVNTLSLKGKKKKKKNKNKHLHQNEIHSSVKEEDRSESYKAFKKMGKNPANHAYSMKKGFTSFSEVIKQNNKECLNVDSKPMKKRKRNRRKKLLQNEMTLNSHEFASNQHGNFQNSLEECEIDTDMSCKELSSNKSTLFQNKAYQKLQAAKFRYLNEMLYTSTGKSALKYFQQNVDEFQDYHAGYKLQVSKWPLNPVDVIIKELREMSKQSVIADLGCGEAKIAQVLSNRVVHSFDLIPVKDYVTACDIANVPLAEKSVDAAVFCLSLMGTNWKDYLVEAYRILKLGGVLKIAEIESRIENLDGFIKYIEGCGFTLVNKNLSNKMFIFLNFKKVMKKGKSSKVKDVVLKPCLYKKR